MNTVPHVSVISTTSTTTTFQHQIIETDTKSRLWPRPQGVAMIRLCNQSRHNVVTSKKVLRWSSCRYHSQPQWSPTTAMTTTATSSMETSMHHTRRGWMKMTMTMKRRRTMMTSSSSKNQQQQQHHKQQQSLVAAAAAATTTSVTSFLVGSLAGTCGSLAGMGGGFIMIPLMTSTRLGLGLTQHQAHGTSLFAVTTTGIAGALSYGTAAAAAAAATATTVAMTSDDDGDSTGRTSNNSNVDITAAAAIALCGMMTARAGALATSRISAVTLRKALGIFMLSVAPLVPAKEYLLLQSTTTKMIDENTNTTDDDQNTHSDYGDDVSSLSWSRLVVPGMIGCCSGFLAGMFGVGGGAVVVPALTVTTDMNHYQALGTSLCAMVPTAVVGTITHYQKGNVVMKVAPALALGAFTGAYLGGKLGLSIPEMQLKYGFSTVMVVLGLQAVFK